MDSTLDRLHRQLAPTVCRIDPAKPLAGPRRAAAEFAWSTPHARRAGEVDPNGVRLLAQDLVGFASRFRAAGLVSLAAKLDRLSDEARGAAATAERLAFALTEDRQ